MPSNLTPHDYSQIINTLSNTRMGTYLSANGFSPNADALEIYKWNALVSGAFFSSLHICEVAVRNGIAGALERAYGVNWPWSSTFEGSLPKPKGNQFKPRDELIRARNKMTPGATGKVIAELKFAFWCHLLTSRYDGRLWEPHLRTEFPWFPLPLSVAGCRLLLHKSFDSLRGFRNRIAHHEHIFSQPLETHHDRIRNLIQWRCQSSNAWLSQWEIVTSILNTRP